MASLDGETQQSGDDLHLARQESLPHCGGPFVKLFALQPGKGNIRRPTTSRKNFSTFRMITPFDWWRSSVRSATDFRQGRSIRTKRSRKSGTRYRF